MSQNEKAIFSAGCFWHVQHDFDKINGVISTKVGYIGGNEKRYPNPKYEMLHDGKTGYAEAVEITFDPKVVSYTELLKYFWEMHDPTLENRQGPDIGTQYRAAIFYLNEKQKKEAEISKDNIQKKITNKIHTTIERAGTFFPAEEYHQKYLEKQGLDACPISYK